MLSVYMQAMGIISVSLLAVENMSDFSPLFFTGMMEVPFLNKFSFSLTGDISCILSSSCLCIAGSGSCSFHEHLHCWPQSVV